MSCATPDEQVWFVNPAASSWRCPATPVEPAVFHRALPGYAPTPLVEMPTLAREWGARRVVVKDESARLGLPSFKALGVFYAVYRVIKSRCAPDDVRPDLSSLRRAATGLMPLELITATDGNHGRALARIAAQVGLPARVYVPATVEAGSVEAIAGEGAEVVAVAEDYDGTVARAAEDAAAHPAAVLVQDTAWAGYEQIPQNIVDGYSTMFVEIDAQLGRDRADLVVAPMGVGSLAQAVIAHYKSRGDLRVLGVEPDTAACVSTSLRAGRLQRVTTGATTMAGLNCGTPSFLAWPYLVGGLDASVTVSDAEAIAAATELCALGVPAGPCGAACLPAVRHALSDEARHAAIAVGADSVVVLLSTERAHSDAV